METFENLKDRLDNLVGAELNKAKAWRNAGQVRRRWYAFGAGVIVGVGVVLLFGCSESPKQTGPNSACFPGPKVVE